MAHIKDIIGYKKEVNKLECICDFLKNTEKYIDFAVDLPNCLLICGQDGVGKTFMAEALIADSEREIFYFSGNGNSVKELKHIFKKAKRSGYSIIFMDDVDLTLNDDYSAYDQIVKELRNLNNGGVFVVVTALKKDNLPDYLLDEFAPDMIMELKPPKIEEACEICKPIFDENKIDLDLNIHDFCCFAQDWTYSEVEDAFNNAALYHEAGHAAVSLLLGGDAACIVLIRNGGGFFIEKEWKTKTYHDKERRYIVSVAGKACEEIFTGTSSIGSYTDLGRVREAIEDDIKISASQGFEYFDSTEYDSPAYNDALAKKVQSDIQKYFDKAKELIVQNRRLIEAFADSLKEKHYLLHSEIYRIYNDYIASVNKTKKAG